MKNLSVLALVWVIFSTVTAQASKNDSIPEKEPLIKAGFSIGVSQSNYLITKHPDYAQINEELSFREAGTFKSISAKPGIFLNIGFFAATKISNNLEIRLNPLLRMNNANLFYEITDGQTTVEHKQNIGNSSVELPLQLNYIFENKMNNTRVHSLGIGYNFVFDYDTSVGKKRRETYGNNSFGVDFEKYFMNIEANINFRLSKKPKSQILTFKTAYSITDLLADTDSYNPYNVAVQKLSLLSFGLLFNIR